MKMSFDNFQIQKWMSQTVRAQNIDENNGVTFLVSFSPSWVTAPKLTKIVSLMSLCRFFVDVSKKSMDIHL